MSNKNIVLSRTLLFGSTNIHCMIGHTISLTFLFTYGITEASKVASADKTKMT